MNYGKSGLRAFGFGVRGSGFGLSGSNPFFIPALFLLSLITRTIVFFSRIFPALFPHFFNLENGIIYIINKKIYFLPFLMG